ncbi:MAG: MFS transporter [Verrucomicrobiota bacterium]
MNPTNSNLITSLKALPRAVWILFFGTFLNRFGSFVIPFLTLYMTRQGFTVGNAGLAIAAYGIGHCGASAIGGHLADTFGRRRTIVLSMFTAAVAMMLLSQARELWSIILCTGLVGLTAELYRPASSALLTDLVTPEQRVTAFATYRLALNAGWAFGPATAGFLAEHSYFWLFVGDALTSVAYGFVALVALPHGLRSTVKKAPWNEAVRLIRRDENFMYLLAGTLAIALVFMQMTSTFSLHVTSQGFSSKVFGLILSLNGVLIVFFELPLTMFTQRFPAPRVMAVGYLLIGAGFGLNAFAHTVPALVLTMTLFTIGEMVSMPVSSAYVASLAPPEMRGRYMGTLGFVWALALVIGPDLGMQLFSRSPAGVWAVCGGLGVVAAWLIWRK